MPLHNASARDDLPHYENPHKQEAVRFLSSWSDLENLETLVDGMTRVERVDCWQKVIERFEGEGVEDLKDYLKDRRAQLEDEVDQQAEFEPASETDAGQQAIADGGAKAVEPDNEWEPDDDQEVVEYEDAAERESKKREAASVAKMFDDGDAVRNKIAEERASDEVRPHVIDALEERLKEVAEQ